MCRSILLLHNIDHNILIDQHSIISSLGECQTLLSHPSRLTDFTVGATAKCRHWQH